MSQEEGVKATQEGIEQESYLYTLSMDRPAKGHGGLDKR
jgi:hypothetical protein